MNKHLTIQSHIVREVSRSIGVSRSPGCCIHTKRVQQVEEWTLPQSELQIRRHIADQTQTTNATHTASRASSSGAALCLARVASLPRVASGARCLPALLALLRCPRALPACPPPALPHLDLHCQLDLHTASRLTCTHPGLHCQPILHCQPVLYCQPDVH